MCPTVGAPFGLYCGMEWNHHSRVVKNAGWYNVLGQKIGFGDLSPLDVRRIARQIPENEMFIMLHQIDSHEEIMRASSAKIGYPAGDFSVEEPGIEYVAEHAMYAIEHGIAYKVDRYSPGGEETSERTISWTTIHPKGLLRRMVELGACWKGVDCVG